VKERPTRPITKDELRAWESRWAVVRDRDLEALRHRSPEDDMRALATMMAAAKSFGWVEDLSRDEADVRERWRVLKAHAA
jgi:hypothetical protein